MNLNWKFETFEFKFKNQNLEIKLKIEILDLRECETHPQCVSLAPPRGPLKLSLLHSIVFQIVLNLKIKIFNKKFER